MSEPGWDDYTISTPASTSAEFSGFDNASASAVISEVNESALESASASAADTATTASDNASAAQEWADWHNDSGDEAVATAAAYIEAAVTAAAGGFEGLAEYEVNFAANQLDNAANSYTAASGYEDTAASAGTE